MPNVARLCPNCSLSVICPHQALYSRSNSRNSSRVSGIPPVARADFPGKYSVFCSGTSAAARSASLREASSSSRSVEGSREGNSQVNAKSPTSELFSLSPPWVRSSSASRCLRRNSLRPMRTSFTSVRCGTSLPRGKTRIVRLLPVLCVSCTSKPFFSKTLKAAFTASSNRSLLMPAVK